MTRAPILAVSVAVSIYAGVTATGDGRAARLGRPGAGRLGDARGWPERAAESLQLRGHYAALDNLQTYPVYRPDKEPADTGNRFRR